MRGWSIGLIGLLSPLLCAGLWSWGTYHLAQKGISQPVQRPSERDHQAVLCKAWSFNTNHSIGLVLSEYPCRSIGITNPPLQRFYNHEHFGSISCVHIGVFPFSDPSQPNPCLAVYSQKMWSGDLLQCTRLNHWTTMQTIKLYVAELWNGCLLLRRSIAYYQNVAHSY